MTPQTEDLIARLEAEQRSWESTRADDFTPMAFEGLLTEAAQALRSLQEEVERLRAIMVPFARMADEEGDYRDDKHLAWGLTDADLTWGDFRAARSALNTGSGEG